jgi:hypothetical protein
LCDSILKATAQPSPISKANACGLNNSNFGSGLFLHAKMLNKNAKINSFFLPMY